MSESIVAKIDEIENQINSEQQYFVCINPVNLGKDITYQVFIHNRNFLTCNDPLWMCNDFIVPFSSLSLDACIAEASVWGRFFGVEVDKSKIE